MSARVERHPTWAAGRQDAARPANGSDALDIDDESTIREPESVGLLKNSELVALLERHVASATDVPSRYVLRRRIVRLHLEAGNADAAAAVLESMVSDGWLVWDLVDLFEQVAAHPGQDSARERLALHYECIDSFDNGARMRKLAVDFAKNPRERLLRARELVRFRLAHDSERALPLMKLMEGLVADLSSESGALAIVYRAVLARALPAWRKAPTDAAFEDAAQAAWQCIDGLTKIYLGRGGVERAARLLKRGAQLRFDHARRRQLLHRAALLYTDRVRDSATAIRLFKQIFEDDGGDEIARSSFDRFRALLDAGGHDAKLAWLFHLRGRNAAQRGDSTDACACLERAGRLWERVSDPVRACKAYTLGSTLGSERSLDGLARVQAARGNWKEAATALEQLAARSTEEPRKYALRVAEAHFALGQIERARKAVDEILRETSDPKEASAARALLLRIHRKAGAFRSVAEMLEEEAVQTKGRRAAALLCEAAEVRRTQLHDAREAVRLLELARKADPANVIVHPALAEALASLEMWDALAEVLAEHVSVHGHRRGAALVKLRLRLAEGLVALGRADDALEHLHFAVKLAPADAAILHARARLELATCDLDSAERTLRAALVAAKASQEAHDASRRVQIYVDLSSIAIERSDRARAIGLLGSALELAIENGEDLRAIEEGLRKLGQHDLLARALASRCTRALTATEQLSALEALLELWQGALGCDPALGHRLRAHDSFVTSVGRALADDAVTRKDEAAWMRLCAVVTTLEATPLLFDIAQARVDAIVSVAPGPERALLRVSVAKMLAERCGRCDVAIVQLFGALDDDPTHPEVPALLAGMLERVGRFDEAADLLERLWHTIALHTPEYLQVAWDLARVLECARRDYEASEVYASIFDALDTRPTDAETLRAIAVRLDGLASPRLADCLERLSALEPQSKDRLAKRLVDLRTAQGDEPGLVRAYELALRGAEPRLDYVDPLVRIYETRGDYDAAARVLRNAVLAAPEDRGLLWRLVEADRRAESDADSLGPLDAALLRSATDVETRILRARVRERIDDVDGALADLRTLDASDGNTAALAVPIVRRIIARTEDGSANQRAIAAADVLSRIGLPTEAEGALELVLARDPTDIGALQRLASAADLRGDWERAADLYGRLVHVLDLPPHDPASGGLVVAFADACQRAGRPADARASLERALARRPDSDVVACQLERTCEAMGAWQRLSELLLARVKRTTDTAKKEKLLLRTAKMLVEEARAPGEALGLLELACFECPDSIEAALECARVLITLVRPEDGLALLEPVLGRACHKSAALRAEILLEMGKAYLALGERAEALEKLRTAFSLHTRNRELAMLLGVVSHDLGDNTTAERALEVAIDLSDCNDEEHTDAVDVRVAMRILEAIALTRDTISTAPSRRVSGIETRPSSSRMRASRSAR